MIKGIVFDFDGVLVESADIKTQAFADLFAKWPKYCAQMVAYHKANMGVSRYAKFRYFYEELLKEPYTDEIGELLAARFSRQVFDRITMAPFVTGAKEFLAATPLPLFIASGTPQDELEVICQIRGMVDFFKGIHGSPATKDLIVQRIMERYSFSPKELVFVGDAEADYKAAIDNGVHFILRRTPDNMSLAAICGWVIADLTNIQTIIEELP